MAVAVLFCMRWRVRLSVWAVLSLWRSVCDLVSVLCCLAECVRVSVFICAPQGGDPASLCTSNAFYGPYSL